MNPYRKLSDNNKIESSDLLDSTLSLEESCTSQGYDYNELSRFLNNAEIYKLLNKDSIDSQFILEKLESAKYQEYIREAVIRELDYIENTYSDISDIIDNLKICYNITQKENSLHGNNSILTMIKERISYYSSKQESEKISIYINDIDNDYLFNSDIDSLLNEIEKNSEKIEKIQIKSNKSNKIYIVGKKQKPIEDMQAIPLSEAVNQSTSELLGKTFKLGLCLINTILENKVKEMI